MPLLKRVPEDIVFGMYSCALRFEGYKYEEELKLCSEDEVSGSGLNRLAQPILDTLVTCPPLLDRNLRASLRHQGDRAD